MRMLAPFVVVAGLCALVAAYTQSNQVDFEEHKLFDSKLDQLTKLDRALNENVLAARSHVIADYDEIPTLLEELRCTVRALGTMPALVPEKGRAPFRHKLEEFAGVLDAKERILERFKSESSLLNNSLRYLPLASRQLAANLLADDQGQLLEASMQRLIQQILVHCLQADGDEEPAIERSLAELGDWRDHHPEHPQANAVARVTAHVRSIVARKPKIEDLTRQILTLPMDATGDELARLYEVELAGVLHRANLIRYGFQGACALLLLGVGYTICALHAANRHLERRVESRTAALSTENRQRRHAEELHLNAERFLHSTLNALSAHIGILDAAGTIVAVNSAWNRFAESNGAPGEAFGLGTNYLSVCESATGACAGEAIPVAAGIRRVLARQEEEFQLEYACHSLSEERWFVVRVTSFQNDGAVFVVVAHENVTARARAEQDSRSRGAELQALFDLMPALIWLKDTKNNFVRVNRCVAKTTGRPVEEIEGKSALEIYPNEAAGYYADDLEVIHSREPKLGIVEKLPGPRGMELWIETSKLPICDRHGEVTGLVVMAQDITQRKRSEAELEKLNRQLLETSRQAGMAEVATSVLHNVGNVLNSINVSSTLVSESVRKSKAGNLGRVVALLDQHAPDLGAFITTNPQGKYLPEYLRQLHTRLTEEQSEIIAEVDSLRKNIEHVNEIVSMQQAYAKVSGVTEIMKVTDLVEDSLRMNAEALARHGVTVERLYQAEPLITVEKHKVLQILVNLIRNAHYACDESGQANKRLTLCVANGGGTVKIVVSDNGVGIPPENLTRIFGHGFTTRKDGHGFGLHSGALAAREMGGALHVRSDGPGRGATFTLELPVQAST